MLHVDDLPLCTLSSCVQRRRISVQHDVLWCAHTWWLLAVSTCAASSKSQEASRYSLVTSCSEDGICPCSCNYAVHQGCTCRDLKGPVAINVTKSEVAMLYPVSPTGTWVPYHIYEEAVNASNCNAAGAYPDPVTCGWSPYLNGTRGAYKTSQVQFSSDDEHKYAGVVLQCLLP
jgi:hypothetical protein